MRIRAGVEEDKKTSFNGAIRPYEPLRGAFVEDLLFCYQDVHKFCSLDTTEGRIALALKVIFVF